jgi:hypothetical protein
MATLTASRTVRASALAAAARRPITTTVYQPLPQQPRASTRPGFLTLLLRALGSMSV